jgi:hypothetical protein
MINTLLLPVTMNIIINLSNIMYNDLWMWNKTKHHICLCYVVLVADTY